MADEAPATPSSGVAPDGEGTPGEPVHHTHDGTHRGTSSLPAVLEGDFRVVAPLMDIEAALATWETAEAFKTRILKPGDYQTFEEDGKPKSFVKKSGWWRLGIFYGVDVRILDERIFHKHVPQSCLRVRLPDKFGDVADCGCPVTGVRYQLELRHPYGRVVPGVGIATLNEKRARYTRLEHDMAGKAFTRAVNRGITLLIGGGDSTAEEQAEAKGLSKEQRTALLEAWQKGDAQRRKTAMAHMRNVVDAAKDAADKDVYVAFLRSADEVELAEAVAMLSGTWAPEEVPGDIS